MVKRLMKSIREFKGASIKAPIFVSLEVVMEVVIPLIMADLIDRGINGGNMPYILKTGLILVLAALMSLCFGALAGKYAATASAGFAKNLRRDMYSHVQEYSFSNIDKFSTGGLVTRLTTDVTNVQKRLSDGRPHCGARALHAGLLPGRRHLHRLAALGDLPGLHSGTGHWPVPGRHPRPIRFLSVCSSFTIASTA